MLSRDGVIARYIFAFCFFFLPGSEMISGWPATVCGLLGSIELASGVLGYSPLVEFFESGRKNPDPQISGADSAKKPDNGRD